MDIQSLGELWDDLNMDRREEATKKIFDYIISDFENFENLIYMELLPLFDNWESMDYFGTEGAKL